VNLGLRPLDAGEAAAAIRQGDAPGGLSWAHGGPSAEDRVVLGIAADEVPTWLIVVDETIVGMCGLHAPIEDGVGVEVGYHVVGSWRGRGIATAAVAELLDHLADRGVDLVGAEVLGDSPWAPASEAVLRGNGFAACARPADVDGARRFEVDLSATRAGDPQATGSRRAAGRRDRSRRS